MTDLLRKKPVACVGVDIFETKLFFVQLSPDKHSNLRPTKHGTVGIAYDALEDGQVASVSQVADSVRQLRAHSTADYLVFASTGDADADDRWRELFMIGGFPHVTAQPLWTALQTLLLRENTIPPILYFTDDSNLTLSTETVTASYPYPLTVPSILDIQSAVTQAGEPIRLCGHFTQTPHDMVAELSDYGIRASLPSVWRNCFDSRHTIPSMLHDDTFAYALSVAHAHHGARFIHESDDQALSTSVLRKPALTMLTDLVSLPGLNMTENDDPTPDTKTPPAVDSTPLEITTPETVPADPTPPKKSSAKPNTPAEPRVTADLATVLSAVALEQEAAASQETDPTPVSQPNKEKSASLWTQDADSMFRNMFKKKQD